MKSKILLVDDEANLLKVISAVLIKDGNKVTACNNAESALELLEKETFDLLITDLKMSNMTGLDLLKVVCEKYPDLVTIMMTAHGTVENAVEAMKVGASDYILKPFDMDEIKLRVKSALNTARFRQQEIKISSSGHNIIDFGNIIGKSQPIREIFSMMKKVSCTDSTVLILGESGTGKELIARGIHNISNKKEKPFIAVNCAAIPENLLESELFGHEKGAFTGAVEKRKGRFELAEDGTLFLDEIGDISASTQVKLLRVLQEKKISRIGSSSELNFTARIITATNKNLENSVKDGSFREDLYYRLNVIPISVPALRDRIDDIEILIDYFLEYFSNKFNRAKVKMNDDAKQILLKYDWPGNIRELENTIEYILVLNENEIITEKDIPKKISDKIFDKNDDNKMLKNMSQLKEKEIISRYLSEFNNNRTKTSEALGISRRTLLNKIRDYGL